MKLPLEKDGKQVGILCVDLQNSDVFLHAHCDETLDGIWRAYLSDGKNECLVGVMEPHETGFYAKKRIPKPIYSAMEMDETCLFGELRFEKMVRLCELRWLSGTPPSSVFSDTALQSAMQRGEGILFDSWNKITRVAFPLDCECGCAPALCLAQVMDFSGRRYAVLGVDQNGNPMVLKGGT